MKLCMGCMNQIDEKMTVCPHCGFNEATLRQESYYLNPGTVIGGKYIVGKALSYGGYTVTYLGLDAEKNRKVVIKEYLPSDFSTRSEGDTEVTIYSGDACDQFEQGLTTFLNEANRIQQLQNPQGIMRVYDCVAENDTGYVISEYLEGKTLKQIMEEGRRFSIQEAKDFVCRILEGLRLVHPLNIIHCDISPETIFVTNTGEIKLLDFGATRYVTTANSKSLAIILKQGFAPEEQYRSRGERGPWTDVYALGAVMYYMITGVVPVESVDRALMDELKEPSKLGIQIPTNIENALMNALNVYQNDRTPSAEIFYQELNSPQVNRIQVKKQKYETGKFPTWAKFLVAGMLCVVVGGGVYVLWPRDSGGVADTNILVDNVIGKTEDQAREILKKNNCTLEVEEAVFDKKAVSGGEVLAQNPAGGMGLEEGQPVKVTLRSQEKCNYSDILKTGGEDVMLLINAYSIDKNKIIRSKNDDPNKKWRQLYKIRLKDKKTLDDSSEDQVITLSEIESISFYVSPYQYVKSLKNYMGKNINDEDVQLPTYTGTGEKRKPTGKKMKPTDEKKYYSFEKDSGYIVEQKGIGESYNSKDDEARFITVRDTIDKGGTLKELIKNLESKGFKKKDDKDNKDGKVVVQDGLKDTDTEMDIAIENGAGIDKDCFTEDNTIIITRKPIPTQKPVVPEPTRKPSVSGGKKLPKKPKTVTDF